MEPTQLCLHCFSQRNGYDICPYCGYAAGSTPEEAYVLHPGTRLWGRYIMGTVLGAGGFGITYRVWDTRLNTMVAIKEFFPQSLVSRIPGNTAVYVFSGDKQEAYVQQRARFIEEAKNMAKFTGDANIVSVLDYFEDNGTAYIVMEYLDGLTLKEYMVQQGGSLPAQQAVVFGAALLKALSTIHQKNIIHRDISPDNIFVLRDGTLKVLDFGAARFVANEGSDLSQGVVVKKGYAPPEQYRTNMKQGVWTDIYAAGATLYKMVTGITPEESIERTEKDVLKRPSQTAKLLDASIDKTVMKAMALRPELRFKSAEAMLAALENRTVIDFPEEELKKRKKRNGLLGLLSAVMVITMAGLVAWRAAQPVQTIVDGQAIVGGQATAAEAMMDGTAVVEGQAMMEGPAIVADTITADTITFFVQEYPATYTSTSPHLVAMQLAEAFMELYPQHTVEIERLNSDALRAAVKNQILAGNAPTISHSYLFIIDEDMNQHKADISSLYASLKADDYLVLDEYCAAGLGKNSGAIYDVPTGVQTFVSAVNTQGAAERGVDVPTAITSFDALRALERETPGTVALNPYFFAFALDFLRPDIGEEEKLDELEDLVVEYAQMYYQGHYGLREGIGNDNPSEYDSTMFGFEWADPKTIREHRQAGGIQIIPLVANDTILCEEFETYSVSNQATENQQKLAMLFLRFMLSENGQNIICVQNDRGIPLQKTALAQYVQAYPEMSFFTGEYADKMALRQPSIYFDNLPSIIRDKATEEEIRRYVRKRYAEWDS